MYVCLEDHETIGHVDWKRLHFSSQRIELHQRLASIEVVVKAPLRDLCALSNWATLKECHSFLKYDMKVWFELNCLLRPYDSLLARGPLFWASPYKNKNTSDAILNSSTILNLGDWQKLTHFIQRFCYHKIW
jgi:hypothetical protein